MNNNFSDEENLAISKSIDLMLQSSITSAEIIKSHMELVEKEDEYKIPGKYNELCDILDKFYTDLSKELKTEVGIIQMQFIFMMANSLSMGFVERMNKIVDMTNGEINE